MLDLGDLDLSQLRLTKKDLETLSSITPSLSKNVQEQLLAQLPPNQAKKLSRTLSMQNQTTTNNNNNNNQTNNTNNNNQEIYRRSMSSNPREMINRYSRDSVTPTNEVFDSINNNTSLINASLRTTKQKYFIDDSLNNNNNNNNHINRERTVSPPPLSDYRDKYYKENISTSNEDIERACFSPPPLKEDSKKTKRYSRVITENNNSEKKASELSTQKILREMRERSIEKNLNHETEGKGNKISYYLDKYATSELNGDPIYANIPTTSSSQHHQTTTSAINDKILDELNSISLLNNQLEKYDQLEVKEVKIKRKKSPNNEKSSRVKEKVIESEENVTVEKSRIARPKSFVSNKDAPLKPVKSSEKILNEAIGGDVQVSVSSKLERPKSFPNSKFIGTPKELKKLSDTLENVLNESTINPENKSSIETEPKKVKKIIKVVKKSTKKLTSSESDTQQPAALQEVTEVKKEKSPEKKASKGLLYTLGQKFEKLRDTKTKKEESIPPPEVTTTATTTTTTANSSQSSNIDMKEKKKKLKAMLNEDVDEMTRQERKSKIDALIKNLKEKSIPHNTELTESGLIKRAVSVEEMPNAFNKNTVNKVLGLFKRIEKENENKTDRVQNTKSTSYLSSIEMSSSVESCHHASNNVNSASIKERPKSGGFIKRNGSSFEPLANICESKIPVKFTCPDCKTNDAAAVVKRHSNDDSAEEKERLKNNRKGLMLDFSRFKSPEPEVSAKVANNYSFPPPLPNDLQVTSPQTPTRTLYDNLTNYSSNAFDISASSLSPNDDIAYDGWSTCSDDHASALHHPMGSMSLTRLRSTQSQGHDDPDESVVDRIRRKSFYNRFNEKKAKRVSTIVGPAAKEYYRERSKPLEYTKAATSVIPDLSSSSRASSVEPHTRATSRYSLASTSSAANRSLSQTRPSKYEKSSDLPTTSAASSLSTTSYHHRRNDLSSLPPPYHVHHTAHHHHMLTSPIDDITSSSKIKSNRNTMYDSSSSSSTNNTPSLSSLYAKRRSFVSTSGNSSSTTTSHYSSSSLKPPQSFVDSYATIGRKMRQYNTRSVSLLDPSIISSSSGSNSYTNTLHDSHLSSSHRSHHLNGYGGDGSATTSSR